MLVSLALLLAVAHVGAAGGVFNVLDYGARGDGHTDDTMAVRKAAAAVHAAQGGILVFPTGFVFLTGSFNLTSNTRLEVS